MDASSEPKTERKKRASAQGEARCRATSKVRKREGLTGEDARCKRYALEGKTLCQYHGGRTEKVSALQRVTHGLRSDYVHKALLPDILARAQELSTAEGLAQAAAVRAAITEAFVDRIDEKREEFLEVKLRGQETIQKGLKLVKELAPTQTAPPSTTIVLADYSADGGVFTGRGVDGPVSVTMIAGVPHMKRGRVWVEARKEIDDETGLEYYAEVVEG